MLSQFNSLTSTEIPKIECDQWLPQNQDYLKAKDKDGPQGGFKSYEEYVYTVNALHAMDNNPDKFEFWFSKLGKHYNDTVYVSYNGLPINPYSDVQFRGGHQLITFINLARDYERCIPNRCTQLLLEKYKPSSPDASTEEVEGTVKRPGIF